MLDFGTRKNGESWSVWYNFIDGHINSTIVLNYKLLFRGFDLAKPSFSNGLTCRFGSWRWITADAVATKLGDIVWELLGEHFPCLNFLSNRNTSLTDVFFGTEIWNLLLHGSLFSRTTDWPRGLESDRKPGTSTFHILFVCYKNSSMANWISLPEYGWCGMRSSGNRISLITDDIFCLNIGNRKKAFAHCVLSQQNGRFDCFCRRIGLQGVHFIETFALILLQEGDRALNIELIWWYIAYYRWIFTLSRLWNGP